MGDGTTRTLGLERGELEVPRRLKSGGGFTFPLAFEFFLFLKREERRRRRHIWVSD